MLENIKDVLFDMAKEAGFTDCEIYYTSYKNFSVSVYQGAVENFRTTLSSGLSFRGIFDGKMGYSYTEDVQNADTDFLIESAKENAQVLNTEEKEFIFSGSENYPTLSMYHESLEKVSAEEKIKAALKMEKAVLGYDEKIASCHKSTVVYASGESRLLNSSGLNLATRSNFMYAYAGAIAKSGEQTKTDGELWLGFDFSEFDPKKVGETAAAKAIAALDAKSMASGKMNVIFSNETIADIISAFSSNFCADSVQKGFSLLKDRLGEVIASPIVTICDDPLLEDGYASSPFDSEGVACFKKNVIEKGVLKTYLHNLKTANLDGTISTGNGFRGSFKSAVSVSPTNFFLEKGNLSLAELIKECGSGIYITDLAGLHSGVNTISGDFSLAANGFAIENGEKTNPVEQITVSGNFFTLLKNITNIADDFKFSSNGTGSAAVLVKDMEIAGK